MLYHKAIGHEGEIKRCPECRKDSMWFEARLDSWTCTNSACNNRVREDFFQTPLPSSRELEKDEIQPDQLQSSAADPLYIKSIKQDYDNEYEESINPINSLEGEYKYHGSAQSALKQDKTKFNEELARITRTKMQNITKFSSSILTDNSQEDLLNRYRYYSLKDRDRNLEDTNSSY
jgi:hypothetical protein